MDQSETYKSLAAARALSYVKPGMVVGLGSGSTARLFVDQLGQRVREGLKIVGVATSEGTAAQAKALAIPVFSLDDYPKLDIDVDGADEFDPELNLIKGGGGALLREKIVAAAAKEMIVIADASKRVAQLGAFPLPVEVNPFGLKTTWRRVEEALAAEGLAGTCVLRSRNGKTFVTDGGHYILDCSVKTIERPQRLAEALDRVVGVVDHGLFIGMAARAIIAGPEGVVEFNARRPPAPVANQGEWIERPYA